MEIHHDCQFSVHDNMLLTSAEQRLICNSNNTQSQRTTLLNFSEKKSSSVAKSSEL